MRSKRIPLSFPKSPLTSPFPLHATRSTGIPGLTGFHEGGKATKRDGFKGRGTGASPGAGIGNTASMPLSRAYPKTYFRNPSNRPHSIHKKESIVTSQTTAKCRSYRVLSPPAHQFLGMDLKRPEYAWDDPL